jgi:hypothetical protein
VEVFQDGKRHDEALGIGVLSQGIGCLRLSSIDERRMSSRQREGKCGISEDFGNSCGATRLAFAVSLPARSLSELLDGWSPQHSLVETIFTMVTHFRSQVAKFIFGGRNSGQSARIGRRIFSKVADLSWRSRYGNKLAW